MALRKGTGAEQRAKRQGKLDYEFEFIHGKQAQSLVPLIIGKTLHHGGGESKVVNAEHGLNG